MNELLKIERVGEAAVVRFLGSINRNDDKRIESMQRQLLALADEKRVLADLGNVGFLHSSVLGGLMALRNKVVEAGGIFILCGTKEKTQVLESIKVKKLHKGFFTIVENEEAAFRLLENPTTQ